MHAIIIYMAVSLVRTAPRFSLFVFLLLLFVFWFFCLWSSGYAQVARKIKVKNKD